jgi:ubiquinone/menaquinone biosynthesis C-methylase UbiE
LSAPSTIGGKVTPGTTVTGVCLVEEMAAKRPPVCDYEGSDYQQSFWDQADRAYEDRVEAIAIRRLLPQSGKRLLEVGAGAGRNTPRYLGFEQVVLLDYSRTQLQQARERLGLSDRYLYVSADVYRLPFRNGVFDGATMIRTLHHLVEPRQALANIREGLVPGATFILEFANKHNIKAILRWLLGRQTWNPFTPEQVEFAELNFNFHPSTVREMLQSTNYRIQKVLTVSHFRMDLLKRAIPLGVLVAVDSLLQWSGALWQLTPSVFLQAVVPGERVPTSPGPIFRCPDCGSEALEQHPQGKRCQGCGSIWAYSEGIYDFREPLRKG